MTRTRTAPAPGNIVIEPATGARYAIGTDGFLDLADGEYIAYDAAFNGPAFFDRPEFVMEDASQTTAQSTPKTPVEPDWRRR